MKADAEPSRTTLTLAAVPPTESMKFAFERAIFHMGADDSKTIQSSRLMNILQVDVNYGQSSTGKIVEALHRRYLKAGHTSSVRYGRGPATDVAGVRRIADPLEVSMHAALTRVTGLTGGYSPLATRDLIRDIDAIKPDVVHLHELHGYYINYIDIIRQLRRRAIPIVWTFHCEFMYTGKCGHAHDCERWQDSCGKCPQKTVYPSSLFFDFTRHMRAQKQIALAGAERLVICCPSQWLAERVGRSFLGSKTIRRVFNGIDTTDIFRPRSVTEIRSEYGLGDSMVLLAVATDLTLPDKGGLWMLELGRKLQDLPVKLVLVGMPEQYRSDNIVAIPRISDQSVLAGLYSAADLVVLPSRKETFSLVCAESLACGTPVVGFDSGAPAEVAPAGFGTFVPYGEIDDLEGVIRRELTGSSTLHSSVQCREFAVARYSEEAMAENYLEAYAMAGALT